MLVPIGVTSQRQRAKFIVRIYRADGLPRCFLLLFFMLIVHIYQADGLLDDDDDDPLHKTG